MPPIDGQVMVPGSGAVVATQGAVPVGPAGGTIPLSTLVEYIIQSTYHELTVLSELLPRKTDMERKIEIVQFASRTRQLFVRLLALVKWANSASKVDKCAMISNFLDQQALLFVDTADMLAKMARVTLVRARLPSFSIPCAIDVLTTGTYPRLPICIKEKIVPPDPISPQEKYQTLFRLNQIIEHRLVTTDLPKHMRRPKIQSGRVIFRVQHEFEVTLTLMGDGGNVPWRLLDIEILVEDPETGDGKALVHSFQVNYIHQLVQARLMENDRPLDDLYSVLHSFCQSLQLEVLHSQSQRLMKQRLGDHIRVEDYASSKKLVLSYWRNQHRHGGGTSIKPSAPIFKLTIFVDDRNPSKPLQISHFPQIQGSESIKVSQTIRSDFLSLEKLLIHTIQVRSLAKLKDLEREFRLIVSGPCETRDLPSVLHVPVVYPCMTTERLSVAVDMQTGHFLASLCSKEISITNDIESSLNGDRRDLRRHLTKLRLWLGIQRCIKSVQHLGVTVNERLPFINVSGHPIEKLSRSHLFIRLAKHSHYYLVVECQESRNRQILYNYYLLQAESCATPDSGSSASLLADGSGATPSSQDNTGGGGDTTDSLQAVYLRAGHMLQLDTFSCTHGAAAKLFDVEEEEVSSLRKRKLLLGEQSEPPQKKQKGSAYFVSELSHILALCEDRIPLMALSQELSKHPGMEHSCMHVDGNGAGLAITLLSCPPCPGASEYAMEDLSRCLLSFTFRIHRKNSRGWHIEALLSRCPIETTDAKEIAMAHRVYFISDLSDPMDKTIQTLLEEWKGVVMLYDVVLKFAEAYKGDKYLQNEIEIKSYTYKRLILAYGPNKCFTCCIQYKSSENQFHLTVGTISSSSVANCHSVMLTQLQRELNHTQSLAKLATNLADTWSVMQSLGQLNAIAMQGLGQRPGQPSPSFTLVPQSPLHVRVVFRQIYCLDIHCRRPQPAASPATVAVRDGAYSKFESSKVVEGCNPISGLKAFLNLFVDADAVASAAGRRRSTVEDDNPPSPIGMDMDTFMASQQSSSSPAGVGGPGSASSQRQGGGGGGGGKHDSMRFQNPLTPGSNPCTPASPATSRGSNQPVIPPSPSNMMAPSPGNPALHVPSPSSFVPTPSPSSLGIHMPSPANQFISPQAMVEGGSPFPRADLAMPSPSMPGPSPHSRHMAPSPQTGGLGSVGGVGGVLSPPARVLPARSWAASVPTVLSHAALALLTLPQPAAPGSASNVALSPLEKFLSCAALRRLLVRMASSDDTLNIVQTTEPGVVTIKAESLHLRFGIHPQTLQSLSIKASASPDMPGMGWEQEELAILEKFFEMKVAVYPYKANTVAAFIKILSTPSRVLKDLIQIMRLELFPEKNMRWSVQWCLTMPLSSPQMSPTGSQMVLSNKVGGKTLFGLQLTRLPIAGMPATPDLTIFVPVLYDLNTNKTQYADNRQQQQQQQGQQQQQAQGPGPIINQMFQRFNEFNPKPNECSLYPAVRELLSNLQVPGA